MPNLASRTYHALKKKRLTEELEQWLDFQSAQQGAEALQPLEATRVLGERFNISHGTVFRLFCRMEKKGRVWRHPNGRFYPALAGRVLGKPKPIAIMLRKMASWSTLSREVMEGFTEQCAAHERPLLLFHNRELLMQGSPDSQPDIASAAKQKELLCDFFLLYGETIAGVLFDELWSEEVIRKNLPKKIPAVSFYRSCEVPGLGNVTADFRTGVLLAMSHLMARGYDEILFVEPFPGYTPTANFLQAAEETYREIVKRSLPKDRRVQLFNPTSRKAFLERLAIGKTRYGIICPEDNLSRHLVQEMRAARIPVGKRHGLVSIMGTSAITEKQITCVRYDFRAMGRAAADMLCLQRLEKQIVAPILEVGGST